MAPGARQTPRRFPVGAVVLLAAVLAAGAAFPRPAHALFLPNPTRIIGDGTNVDSYGFDLSTCLIPRDQIAASGLPKDGLRALVNPFATPASELDSAIQPNGAREDKNGQGRYLPLREWVVAVEVNGEARAYAASVLNWRLVINDTLGGLPIAVTYNPLSHCAVVFDRRAGGEILEFGVSGLLHDSALLLFDRRPGAREESLWSQVQCRAVAGPAAAERRPLAVLPSRLVQWSDWLTRRPDTTVVMPGAELPKPAERHPGGPPLGGGALRFAGGFLPLGGVLTDALRLLAVSLAEARTIFSAPVDVPGLGKSNAPSAAVDVARVRSDDRAEPQTVFPAWRFTEARLAPPDSQRPMSPLDVPAEKWPEAGNSG